MLEKRSFEQFLAVLRHFRSGYQSGGNVRDTYRSAVDKVSQDYGVTYQTIGDLCRRRLRLSSIEEFYDLLEGWVGGDTERLMEIVKKHTDPQSAAEMDRFLSSPESRDGNTSKSEILGRHPEQTTVLSLRVDREIARQIRVLAETGGVSIGDWMSQIITKEARSKYKEWLEEEIARFRAGGNANSM